MFTGSAEPESVKTEDIKAGSAGRLAGSFTHDPIEADQRQAGLEAGAPGLELDATGDEPSDADDVTGSAERQLGSSSDIPDPKQAELALGAPVGAPGNTNDEPPLVEDLPPATAPLPPLEELPPPPGVGDLPPAELRSVVESLLFVSHRPLTVARLAACLPGVDAPYLEGFLQGLADRFTSERRGWELRREANGWQLMTRVEHHPWVRQLERRELPTKLTKGAMETLAVVAYKQPVTRGAIEDIRGVQCGPVLRQLMDLRLVQVTGREEGTLGRPLLYGTTDLFLQRFGLGGLRDLPRRYEMGG